MKNFVIKNASSKGKISEVLKPTTLKNTCEWIDNLSTNPSKFSNTPKRKSMKAISCLIAVTEVWFLTFG